MYRADEPVSLFDATVLVVDDTPANLDLISRMLEEQGYRVLVATSGNTAQRIASATRPDLILLDVVLPDLDGFAVCRALKENDSTADIPIVFVTAIDDADALSKAFDSGAQDYLRKPLQREEVCARVRNHIRTARYRERVVEEAEQRRAILHNMSEGVIVFDAQGMVLSVNPAAHRLLGTEHDAVIGHPIMTLVTPQSRHRLARLLESPDSQCSVGTGEGPQRVSMRHSDGRSIELDLTITVLFGREARYIALLHQTDNWLAPDLDAPSRSDAVDHPTRIIDLDPLTDLANRRRFEQFLDHEWRRARRVGEPVALALVDIDHFHALNRLAGPERGDQCLVQIARLLQGVTRRPTDLAARYSGGLFALVFSGSDADIAQVLTETVRAQAQALALAHPGSSTSEHLTLSIGVSAEIPASAEPHGLINAAERALQRAKTEGRNRVISLAAATHAAT